VTSTIRGVRFRGDVKNSSCCDPQRVVNISATASVLNYTDRWVEPARGGGLYGFLLVLVHEARHAQGLAHTCGTKDQTIEEMGSWGVQYYLTRWLVEHTDQAFFSSGSIQSNDYLAKQSGDDPQSADLPSRVLRPQRCDPRWGGSP
jgi:hypothetical protein